MKKKIFVLFTACIMAFGLTACQGKGKESTADQSSEAVEDAAAGNETAEGSSGEITTVEVIQEVYGDEIQVIESAYETYDFIFANTFQVTVRESEVIFDGESGHDVLLLYTSIRNLSDKEAVFTDMAALSAVQGEKELEPMKLKDINGDLVFSDKDGSQKINRGETFDKTIGWNLESDETVTIQFVSKNSEGEPIYVTYDVKERLTEPFREALGSSDAGEEE